MYAFICTQKHNVCLITSFKCFIYSFNVLHTFCFTLQFYFILKRFAPEALLLLANCWQKDRAAPIHLHAFYFKTKIMYFREKLGTGDPCPLGE